MFGDNFIIARARFISWKKVAFSSWIHIKTVSEFYIKTNLTRFSIELSILWRISKSVFVRQERLVSLESSFFYVVSEILSVDHCILSKESQTITAFSCDVATEFGQVSW